jgi:hypothetical protein
MTQVAQQFPRHTGSTILYINFDGWRRRDRAGHTIQSFQSTTGDRDSDIQDILYRVSEIFAPFDVRVVRLFGDGNFDRRHKGNTTVFVGGDTANISKAGKYNAAYTPSTFTDFPGFRTGQSHQPNSNPYDLAFVDPMSQNPDGKGWLTRWDNRQISQAIAHEAGHTFGLAHVLSRPMKEIMSYDAPNRFFANRTFALTDLNYDPIEKKKKPAGPASQPHWNKNPIRTQNSFTYLRAVLGTRPPDDYANVADRTAVDPSYQDGKMLDLILGCAVQGTIGRSGDYDVFRLICPQQLEIFVSVEAKQGDSLDPVLLVYDDTGRNLVAFNNDRVAGNPSSYVQLEGKAGQTFLLVVGAANGASRGSYVLLAGELNRPQLARQSK